MSSAVKNKPVCSGEYGKREHYAPFGNIPVNEVISVLKQNQKEIGIFRQILCLDEVFDGENLRYAYLDEYAEVTKQLQQYGKVILDFHQDLFSRQLGGCGLPAKYHPESLRNVNVNLKEEGKYWGSEPLTSVEQKLVWAHFFKHCKQMYSNDINKVIEYLATKLDRFYDYIDILNEPGTQYVYHAKAVFKSYRLRAAKQLSDFYAYVCNRITINCKLIIEPYNYDVSQVVGNPIGLQPFKCKNELVFGPHLYEPVFLKKKVVLISHLRLQQKLGINELLIGECGDLSNGVKSERFSDQLRLFQQLDIPALIWELNPVQGTNEFICQQDAKPWNQEVMSVVKETELTKIGQLIPSAPKKLKIAFFDDLKGQLLKIYFKEQKFNFVQKLNNQQEITQFRILALQRNFSVQFVQQYVFSEIDLGDGTPIKIDLIQEIVTL